MLGPGTNACNRKLKGFLDMYIFSQEMAKRVVGDADHNAQNCRTENHFINYLEGHNDKWCHNSSSRESSVLS